MNLKKPLSFDEQIEKIKNHGIIIANKDIARDVLRRVNYYRFTGYAIQYRKQPGNSGYIEDILFEDIYNIYKFDEVLRDIFRRYIEKIEVYFRTQIAYGFSVNKCNMPPYDQHYNEENFYNKKGYQEVMANFKKEKNYYKDSLIVNHHKLKYESKMPLWVIVELMSFSNLSKLYSCMYYSEKDIIASAIKASRDTLENHLHCLSVLRNKCAHAARLYNTKFNPPAKFTKEFLKAHPQVKNDTLFAYTLILVKRLPDSESKYAFITLVQATIEEYCDCISMELIGFPTNYVSLLKNNL